MIAPLRPAGMPAHRVDERLLGQNIELALDVAPGLLSERLDNPFFFGPGDWQTRIAGGWQPVWHYASPSVRFDLTAGMAVSGWQSQLIHNHAGAEGGICQTGRYVRKGERLKVSLWARVQHQPVALRVGLRPLKASLQEYACATIDVTAAYWKAYETVLTAPADDDAAVFYCVVPKAGMVWLDQIHLRGENEGHLRSELIAAIEAMRIGPLRFPGGHASSAYHWRNGIGPLHRRPHLPEAEFRFPDGMRYDFGTDEYLALCRDLKIIPQITINVGSGTPDEAGDWAAYCRQWWQRQGLTPPSMYWQIGNETYLTQEVGHCTPAMYVEAVREFAPLIRRGYPEGRIIVLGQDGFSAEPGGRTWRATVLDDTPPDLYDLVDVHHYSRVPEQARGPERQDGLVNAADDMLRGVAKAAEELRGRGLDRAGKRVSITEWNVWQWASHHDGKGFYERYDVEHALFTALVLHRWVRMGPELELANFYNLVNVMGILVAKGPRFEITPVADVFKLYRSAFPARVRPVALDSPAIAGGTRPAVDAICLAAEGEPAGVYALFINVDGAQTREVALPAELGRPVEVTTMRGSAPFDEAMPIAVETGAGRERLALPPLSITRVRMEQGR